MSSSNAAAIRRRAGIQASTPTPSPTPSSTASNTPADQSQPRKLTLPEVVANFDQRISKLEKDINSTPQLSGSTSNSVELDNLGNILNEYNERFEMIASEITNIKNNLLSLQTYTMDVNKMLLNERVRILSDLGNNVKIEDADISSVFSLPSANDTSQVVEKTPGSPTSVDMREEVGR
jgi:predicted  nucleic acid-binding Zn-ribbon protein